MQEIFENIYIEITNFVQYSDHDKNSSNNENKAIDTDYDYNTDDELMEPYPLDKMIYRVIRQANTLIMKTITSLMVIILITF